MIAPIKTNEFNSKSFEKVLDEILWTWYYNQVASTQMWLANRSLKTEQW